MNNFQFYSPTEFVFGKGTENEAGKYVKKHGGTKVLLHYGGGSAVRSGLLDRVKASLDAEGISYAELGGVKPNPRDTLVYEGIQLCRSEGIDFLLATGRNGTDTGTCRQLHTDVRILVGVFKVKDQFRQIFD